MTKPMPTSKQLRAKTKYYKSLERQKGETDLGYIMRAGPVVSFDTLREKFRKHEHGEM